MPRHTTTELPHYCHWSVIEDWLVSSKLLLHLPNLTPSHLRYDENYPNVRRS